MKAVIVAIVLAVAALAAAAPLTEEQYEFLFTRFITQYDKNYATSEFFAKYNTFKKNLNGVIAHNSGEHTYSLAMNQFGDLNSTEFEKVMGLNAVKAPFARSKNVFKPSGKKVNAAVDWRKKNVVNAMKNQGQCGSCWAFSANAAVETTNALAGNGLKDLSEQQLVDCSGPYGNYGCGGGLMTYAFEFTIDNGGLCETSAYPYTASDDACKTSCKPVQTISSYTNIGANDESALEAAVNESVVAVAISATTEFQFYSEGIFNGPCQGRLNHGVAAVGYDSENGQNFWIVRNSWGTTWGEAGYIKMAKGKNLCQIAAMATFVSV